MLSIKNFGSVEFRKYARGKKIYIWGAGRALESCLDIYFEGQDVQLILDNNRRLWGKSIQHNNKEVFIGGKDLLLQHMTKYGVDNSLLMITSSFYGPDIVADLDKNSELDGLECFLQIIIRSTKENIPNYSFSDGKHIIPKKIHYIWIGGNPLPQEFKDNIETWKKYNPDYKIICWNESNYDFLKCDYVREAYESKCYSFASNYARLDIVFEHGGIYLDTDVECIASFDKLLNDEAFFNMGCTDRINIGCGFGAIAGSTVVKDMMVALSQNHFLLPSGRPEKKPFNIVVNPVMKKYGFKIENYYQKKGGVVLYPCEVMSPKTIEGLPDFYSDKTVSIHWESGTWKTSEEEKSFMRVKEIILTRLDGFLKL
ncbi:Glycosyltransferase sugar-binding region containing DXD motif-containing protein [Selenomonas ruminantium]|uniref:Glycosyltransferase sugar-binding region containing DXD motif-containing protein n=1 Tax=Selenomonas ruminantium TaxID=971 RepID=A0A1M6UKK5_SELRU|nr:glycosyltransferase [Selenomonas ruminantium]SHK69721.1 Glycosyltransferase sugar-binding region containing DXD motif-containing protein [Selenomonas ruminantium]